jgi:two-component system sensor histidine kinase KdpD
VHVDGPLFERVLINLLENAHKYAGARADICSGSGKSS